MDLSVARVSPAAAEETIDKEEDAEAWDDGAAVVLAPRTPRVMFAMPDEPDAAKDDEPADGSGDQENEEEEDEEEVEESPMFTSGKGLVVIASEAEPSRRASLPLLPSSSSGDVAEQPEAPEEWDGGNDAEAKEEAAGDGEAEAEAEEGGDDDDAAAGEEEPDQEQEEDDGDDGHDDAPAAADDKAEAADHWSDEEAAEATTAAVEAHHLAPVTEVVAGADLGLQGEEMALLAEHLRRVEEGIRFAMRSLATSEVMNIDPDVPIATVTDAPAQPAAEADAVAAAADTTAAATEETRSAAAEAGEEAADGDDSEGVDTAPPVASGSNDDDFFADVEPDPPSPRPSANSPQLLRVHSHSPQLARVPTSPLATHVEAEADDEEEEEGEEEEEEEELPPLPQLMVSAPLSPTLAP